MINTSGHSHIDPRATIHGSCGITMRQHFACNFAKGMLAAANPIMNTRQLCIEAIEMADYFIEEYNKP